MQHDQYDYDVLKQLKRIATALEKIEKKMPEKDPGLIFGVYDTTEYGKTHPECAKRIAERTKSCSWCAHSLEDGARTCNVCNEDHDKWEYAVKTTP